MLNCTYSGTVVYTWYVSRTFAVGSFCWLGIKRINVFFIFLFDVRKNSFNFVKPYKYVKKNTENKHFSCIKTLFCGIASPVLHSLAWLPNRLHTLYLYAITYVISYWFSVSVYTAENVSIPPSETPPQSMGDPRAGARLLYDSYKWRPLVGSVLVFITLVEKIAVILIKMLSIQ